MSTVITATTAQRLRPLDRFELAGTECTVQSIYKNDETELVEICFRTPKRPLARKLVAWYADEYVIKYDPKKHM